MGSLSTTVTLAQDYKPQIITIPTERHMLYSITLNLYTPQIFPNSVWATIGLLNGGTDTAFLAATLTAGHVIFSAPLGWSGLIPTSADMYIFALVAGLANQNLTLHTYLLPYTFSPEKGIIVDP